MARLEEEGLYEEWLAARSHVAKFKEDGGIILFTHYDWDSKDGYWEFHYPPFNEMRKNESFVRECKSFYDGDDEFVGKLAKWLEGVTDECPLSPVDAYRPGAGLETKVVEFMDDPEDIEEKTYQSVIDYYADVIPTFETQIAGMGKVLYGAIHTELDRGHNLQEDYVERSFGGLDWFLDYYVGLVESVKVVVGSEDELGIECKQDNETFVVPLGDGRIPVWFLIEIYENMK